MARVIQWKLHFRSSPDALFPFLTTDEGRVRFWAEQSAALEGCFALTFPDGTQERCEVLESTSPSLFRFRYFGSEVTIRLEPDGSGGTDLTLINTGVSDAEYAEVNAGWVSVLLALKATADFGIDLRNHDSGRTWAEGYVDQ